MRETYCPGHKYDSAITAYLDIAVLGVSGQDEMIANEPDGGWLARIGRRIVEGYSDGSVYSYRYDTVEEATAMFATMADSPYFASEEDES